MNPEVIAVGQNGGPKFSSDTADKPWGFREFCVRTNKRHRMVFARRLA